MPKRIAALVLLVLFALPAISLAEDGEGVMEITDRAGLARIAEAPDARYRLTCDIDLSGGDWLPIDFSGTLDGNGHTLYNLRITSPGEQIRITIDGNGKKRPTQMYGLFSFLDGGTVKNLRVIGAEIIADTSENCFASILTGGMQDGTIDNCLVEGRVTVRSSGQMQGAAGVAGFGNGAISRADADVVLTVTDEEKYKSCEQYSGAILACGYADINACRVRVRTFASVFGYVHNGGIMGMYRVHTDARSVTRYITGNRVNAEISFFEGLVEDRRAYCAPEVGEIVKYSRVEVAQNEILHFVESETRNTRVTLLPEMCQSPVYREHVTPPTCDAFGFTRFTCTACGYSYRVRYIAPIRLKDRRALLAGGGSRPESQAIARPLPAAW